MSAGSEKGSVLVVSLSMVAVMGILSISLMAYAMMEVRGVEEYERRMVAFHLAESAVDVTMVQIKSDGSYSGLATTSNSYGDYSSTVCSSTSTSSCPDPSSPPASTYYRVVGTGAASNTNSTGVAQSESVVAVIQRSQVMSEFDFGIFADGGITMNGGYTDSYNSTDGPYSAAAANENGDVGTNSTGAGAISLIGSGTINGDAFVGEGGDPLVDITTTGSSSVVGDSQPMGEAIVLTSPSVPDSTSSSGQLKATGTTVRTVAGGTYWYTSIQTTGGGQVSFTGPTVLYVTGNVQIAGNGFTSSGDTPADLTIYVVGSGSVSVSGNGAFYGTIYAPDSSVSVGGGAQIYGAVIADTVTLNGNSGAAIHYDEALGSGGGSSSATTNLISWTDRL